jgi:hypothetical protein
MATVSSREKALQLAQMTVPGDTLLVAVGHRAENKTRYTISIETGRVSDLVAIASTALAHAIQMILELDTEKEGGFVLGQLSAVALILEEITGEHETPEAQA